MKKSNLILFSILGLAFTTMFMSCKKTDPDKALSTIIQAKGAISLTVESQTYNKLFSSVVYSKSDTMVTFWGINTDTEDSFIVTFGTVPEVGKTKTVSMQGGANDIIFMIQGSFRQGGLYTGESGTIKRVSTDKYELNIEMSESQNPNTLINISGTVTVGETK